MIDLLSDLLNVKAEINRSRITLTVKSEASHQNIFPDEISQHYQVLARQNMARSSRCYQNTVQP